MTDTDILLASNVAVGPVENWGQGCVAWVESKDAECGKERAEGYLCKRHLVVAGRRAKKRAEETQARIDAFRKRREEQLRLHGDKWRAELAKVNAELERRTGTLTTDRAAFGGVGCAAVDRHRMRQFSDSNVQRVGELLKLQKDLERKLGGYEVDRGTE